MKLRLKRKQFWWTWHVLDLIGSYKNDGWGMARIKHQIKDWK